MKTVDRFVPTPPDPPVSFMVKVKGAGPSCKIKDSQRLVSLLVIMFVSIHSSIRITWTYGTRSL